MAKIIITIDGDNITVNQSAAPTKGEQKNKKFFIIIREEKYNNISWVEFSSDDYTYKLYMQDEKGNILPCNGTDWDIDR